MHTAGRPLGRGNIVRRVPPGCQSKHNAISTALTNGMSVNMCASNAVKTIRIHHTLLCAILQRCTGHRRIGHGADVGVHFSRSPSCNDIAIGGSSCCGKEARHDSSVCTNVRRPILMSPDGGTVGYVKCYLRPRAPSGSTGRKHGRVCQVLQVQEC